MEKKLSSSKQRFDQVMPVRTGYYGTFAYSLDSVVLLQDLCSKQTALCILIIAGKNVFTRLLDFSRSSATDVEHH